MEYILTYADILFRYLLDAGIPQEQANLIATNALDQLALWVDENCIRKCGYACIRRSESSGYCTLCSYMIQPFSLSKQKGSHSASAGNAGGRPCVHASGIQIALTLQPEAGGNALAAFFRLKSLKQGTVKVQSS